MIGDAADEVYEADARRERQAATEGRALDAAARILRDEHERAADVHDACELGDRWYVSATHHDRPRALRESIVLVLACATVGGCLVWTWDRVVIVTTPADVEPKDPAALLAAVMTGCL